MIIFETFPVFLAFLVFRAIRIGGLDIGFSIQSMGPKISPKTDLQSPKKLPSSNFTTIESLITKQLTNYLGLLLAYVCDC